MTDCPPKLRGDLSKWLCEINAGVYVGHMSSRVRDAIWERICSNLKNGRATMVYTTNCEQKMSFRTHNTSWTPVDFDGITLMRHPLPQASQATAALKPGFSNAAKHQIARKKCAAQASPPTCYVIVDLETTGLNPEQDSIIELGAIKVENNSVIDSFSCLVRCERGIPKSIIDLTGITESMLIEQGIPQKQALQEFLQFIGHNKLIGYNIKFDMHFLHNACRNHGFPLITNHCIDLLSLARRKVYDVPNYKLSTLAEHFSLSSRSAHRALGDCKLAFELYNKMAKIT